MGISVDRVRGLRFRFGQNQEQLIEVAKQLGFLWLVQEGVEGGPGITLYRDSIDRSAPLLNVLAACRFQSCEARSMPV